MTVEYQGVTLTISDCDRQKTEIWDRVMGYFRTVDDFNVGKRQEHKDRVRFTEKKIYQIIGQ